MPLKATTDSLLRLTGGTPLVVVVGVVRLVAAVVGELADGVERCFVCCAVQSCFNWIKAESCPLRHWHSATNYTCDFFGALVIRDETCFNDQRCDRLVDVLHVKTVTQVHDILLGLSAASESLILVQHCCYLASETAGVHRFRV